MKTEAGHEIVPARAWGSNTKVTLVITLANGDHERVVDEWRAIIRSMDLTKGEWTVPDTARSLRLTKPEIRALEEEIRALHLG